MKVYNHKSPGVALTEQHQKVPRLTVLFFAMIVASIYIVPASAQEVTIDNSVISIPSGTFITTGGGITTQSSGGIDNSGNVELKGDWTNNANGLINGSSGTVKFYGTGSQDISGTSSTDFYNLDVTNTGGVTMQQGASVENQLTLNSHVRLGNSNLILSAGAPAVAGTLGAANGMVVCNGSGMMRKLYSANGNYLFPLGEVTGTTEYSPLQLNFTSGAYGGGAYAEATTVNAKHPDNGSNINWLNRYWDVNSSNISSFNCNLTGNYLVADIAGTETAISSARLTGIFNQLTNPWVKYQAFTGAHTLIANNVTQFSSFTGITLANPTVSITGPSSKCTGQPAVTLTANPVGDAVFAYSWSTGATTSSISANPVVNTNYTVTATDANGITAVSNMFTLTVNTSPTATISGNGTNDICLSQTASIHLVFTGTGPWNYTVSDGVQNIPLVSTVNPDNKNIIPNTAGTHNYTVTVLNDAFCSGTAAGTAVVTVSSTGPGIVTGGFTSPASACATNVSLITVTAVSGQNIHYSWQTGSNSSVVLFSTNIGGPFTAGPFSTPTNQVYAQFGAVGPGQSGYDVCVQGVNGCGSTTNRCIWIRGVVNTPGPITPPNGVVACGNSNHLYSCGTSGGATVYTWTLSGSTAPISPNMGNNPTNVTVSFPNGFTSGQLCVTAALACGGSSTSAPRCITVSNNPANPAVPTGSATVCPLATGVPYSIPAVPGATGYTWTVPAGATIATGANSPSITVNFPTPFTGSNSVCVTATSSCGASAVKCKTVNSGVPSQPAGITGPLTNVCASLVSYSVVAPIGGLTYTWTNPAGTTLTGQGSTPVQVAFPSNFTSGVLTVTASSPTCPSASSAARSSSAIWGRPNNAGAITQYPPGSFCPGAGLNFSVVNQTPAATYTWTSSNGSITAGQGSSVIDVTWGNNLSPGTITVKAGNTCGLSAGTNSQTYTAISCREEGINATSETAFSIYPNPAHDHVTVSLYAKEPMEFTIKLLDMAGRVLQSEVHEGSAGLNTYNLEWEYFIRGIYMLDVQSGRHSWKEKLVIE